MRLEPQMWDALESIARQEGTSLNNLCTQIDQRRREVGLTSATRVFIISYYRQLVRRQQGVDTSASGGAAPGTAAPSTSAHEPLARVVLDTVVGRRLDHLGDRSGHAEGASESPWLGKGRAAASRQPVD